MDQNPQTDIGFLSFFFLFCPSPAVVCLLFSVVFFSVFKNARKRMRIRMRMSAINELISRHNVPWLMFSNRYSGGIPQAIRFKVELLFWPQEYRAGTERH